MAAIRFLPVPAPSRPHAAVGCFDEVLHFLDKTHIQIDQALDRLNALAATLRSHHTSVGQRREAYALMQFLGTQARQHHHDEEQHIFPRLLACEDVRIAEMAWKLLQDHGWIEACWAHITPMLNAVSQARAVDDEALRDGASVLHQIYTDHMLLEESIAYPASSPLVADQACAAAMRQEMQRRRQLHARKWTDRILQLDGAKEDALWPG